MKKVHDDGISRSRIITQPHEGKLYVAREASPEHKRAVRENTVKLRREAPHQEGVRLHLQMTEEDFHRISMAYPEIHSGTQDERRRAWEKVARLHPELVAKEFKGRFHHAG